MVFGPVSGFTQPWWSSRSCVIKLDIIGGTDRKSTRLNSSHDQISYAVFCLKKKKIYQEIKGSTWNFVNLWKSVKASGMVVPHVNSLLTIANNDLPSVELRSEGLRKEAANVE